MFSIEYRKGDMLDNINTEDIFVHACNAIAHWGRGIAKQLADKFPSAYTQYRHHPSTTTLGSSFIVQEKGIKIGCLITSRGVGKDTDPPESIAGKTYLAIKNLLANCNPDVTIHSPKLNAGLFHTPWEWTEKAIKQACEESGKNVKWIVWEL